MDTVTRQSTFRPPSTPDDPVRVDVRRHPPDDPPSPAPSLEGLREAVNNAIHADLATDLDRVRRLANWMDARFSIAGVRFGLDGLIGLIPGIGDTVTALVSLYPLAVARRHKLGRWAQGKILGNIALDWLVGLVPLVGDLFDVGYKANLRNLRVIERAAERRGVVPPVVDAVSVAPSTGEGR
jgi:hypothetical protein